MNRQGTLNPYYMYCTEFVQHIKQGLHWRDWYCWKPRHAIFHYLKLEEENLATFFLCSRNIFWTKKLSQRFSPCVNKYKTAELSFLVKVLFEENKDEKWSLKGKMPCRSRFTCVLPLFSLLCPYVLPFFFPTVRQREETQRSKG